MSWLRIDPGFAHHPKLLSLTPAERWRWIGVLCYTARFRSPDLSAAVLRHLRISPRLLDRLLELRLLEKNNQPELVGYVYRVHDWEHYYGGGRERPEGDT